jgi:hypothetical protein
MICLVLDSNTKVSIQSILEDVLERLDPEGGQNCGPAPNGPVDLNPKII